MIKTKIVFFIITFFSITIHSSQPAQSSGIVTTTLKEDKASQQTLFNSIIEIENEVQKIIKESLHDYPSSFSQNFETASEIRKNFLENDDQKERLSRYYWLRAYEAINDDNHASVFLEKTAQILNKEFPDEIKMHPEYQEFYNKLSKNLSKQQYIISHITSQLGPNYTTALKDQLNIQNCQPIFAQYLQNFTGFLELHSNNDFELQKNKEKVLDILRKKALIMTKEPFKKQKIRLELTSTNHSSSSEPQSLSLNLDDMVTPLQS